MWLQKVHPAILAIEYGKPYRLVLAANKRTIFHELALKNSTKVRNAIVFNFVAFVSNAISLKCTFIPGMTHRDTYGWKPSDYLVARGATDSLFWMCLWVMATDQIHGVPAGGTQINFRWISLCSDLFAGPDNVLMRIPPELSETLGGTEWPATGKSPRQLAQDLGHEDIVELIDFIQFHAEGSSLCSYVQGVTACKDASLAAAKLSAKTFAGFVEAGRANSKCTLDVWDAGSCITNDVDFWACS